MKKTKNQADYYAKWRDKNREHLRAKHREYHKKYRDDPRTHELIMARHRRYHAKHKAECNAQQRVNYWIASGHIKKQPCEICGAEPAHAHHDDYTRPLKVRWLCPIHHSEWHRNNKPKTGEVDKEATKADRKALKTDNRQTAKI